ncbi:unnamed protein product [Acanthoscelides obtectus]|nr:unnamed protein product [Acanthoscelides obtectus]CAK1628191.1 hypothetical protein AOBTE_LOCUS5066 [Acanthoscelides obtectus]
MQSSAGFGNRVIQYSTVNITENSIPIWGSCHRRIGNNYILIYNYSETSCIRCLHLKLRSASVLQVYTVNQETISKCFTNEKTAEENCPSDESVVAGETAEILLFKTRDVLGQYTPQQYCPFDGKYSLKYNSFSKRLMKDCFGYGSLADSCPSGSTINLRPRNCSTNSYDMNFDCLANWEASSGDNYLILVDSTNDARHPSKQKPIYRCALYKEDTITGNIQMALSKDSTCTNELFNSSYGYEVFQLESKPEKVWPIEVTFGICTFPKWMHGDWEHLIVRGDTMVYRDRTSFKTYTIKCVGVVEDSDKYLVFSRTQCDEEFYSCVRIANRSNNILEFQIGKNTSKDKDVFSLCQDENFEGDTWITQGRQNITIGFSSGMCPITGEYTGKIPDATNLCAKLWSDCRAPELMYYQVSHCDSEEVYEEREYQCLGHWREGNFLYTYTQRNDVAPGTYECFVGSIITDMNIYIKEAGGHCQRNVDPLRYGMQLTKKRPLYSCIERSTTPRHFHKPTTERIVPKPTSTIVHRTTTIQHFSTSTVRQTHYIEHSSSKIPVLSSGILCLFLFLHMFVQF